MSYFLSEWIGGYEVFLEVGEMSWYPEIKLKQEDLDLGHATVSVSFFDVEKINALVDLLGPGVGNKFVDRLNIMSKYMYDKIGLEKFLKNNLLDSIKKKSTLEEASLEITHRFWDMLLDFEFWNRVNLVEVFANLIFYGTWEFPKPLIFFVPPLNDWEESDWTGYIPSF